MSARPTPPSNAGNNVSQLQTAGNQAGQQRDEDVDLQRAKDLLQLHTEVKLAHGQGSISQGLMEARQMVKAAIAKVITDEDDDDEGEAWT